jgi:integrase/recombinase XerC
MIRRGEHGGAGELVERFCLFLEHEGKRPLTIKNYRCDIEGYVRWAKSRKKREFNLGDFAPDDLKRYREWIIQGLKAGSTNRKLAALKKFLCWAADSGLLKTLDISELGNVEFVRKERTRPRWLDSTEQVRLLRAVEDGSVAVDKAAIHLMLNTGIRAPELCELRWTAVSINGDEGKLHVVSSSRLKPFIKATIPLNLEARSALISLGYENYAGKDQFVFSGRYGPMTRRGVDMLVERYSRIAGIEKVTPGMLRHSFCMNLVRAGVSPYTIASLIGNGSMEMIRCYYVPLQGAEVPESMPTPETIRPGASV